MVAFGIFGATEIEGFRSRPLRRPHHREPLNVASLETAVRRRSGRLQRDHDEAFAEYLHERVRPEWGYGLKEEDLIQEKYRGIRPAAGYPA